MGNVLVHTQGITFPPLVLGAVITEITTLLWLCKQVLSSRLRDLFSQLGAALLLTALSQKLLSAEYLRAAIPMIKKI